jgi:hypothetical protein
LNLQPPVNPYIAGNPITGTEMFYGREDVFSFIQRNLIGLHGDTPVVLYGQRRTGKTSVLYQLHRHLDPTYRCVFMDLHGLNLDGMGNLMLGIANSISQGLQRDYQLTVTVPDRALFLADPKSTFEAIFLYDALSALGRDHLVLMLDELVRLDEEVRLGHIEREVFDFLRHLMQHHARLNFIFSLGSSLEEMEKEYAFVFNVALYHRISFLESAAAQDLILQPVKDHYRVAPEAVERILQVTSGHPYYTQLVCHCLFDLWLRSPKPVMSADDVDAVLGEAIELGSANLTYVWQDSTPGEQAMLAGMAVAMREQAGPVTADHARDAWRRVGVSFPRHEASRALRSLIGREVIAGSDLYSFAVDLQRLWLEKHRRLEWVKDDLGDSIQKWDPAESWLVGIRQWIAHRRYLAIAAIGVVLVGGYVAVARVAGTPPFSPSQTFGGPPRMSPALVSQLPADLPRDQRECRIAVTPKLGSMPRTVQTWQCIDRGLLNGRIYIFQLDSADFQAAWHSFNLWWGFTAARAGACPPTKKMWGIIDASYSGSGVSQESLPSAECGLLPLSPKEEVPAYAWSYPASYAFMVAEGAPGSSFSDLAGWVTPPPIPQTRQGSGAGPHSPKGS